VSTVVIQNEQRLSRLKLFLALSRTHHAVLDMATPGLAAVMWLGAFPSAQVVLLGLITACAGYTAVYSLNDVVDHRVDRDKLRWSTLGSRGGDLDAVYVRHPIAQGMLSFSDGALWTGIWAALALVGSYILNPVCAYIFLVAGTLEVVYCLLLRVTHLRALISGVVKTSGGIAAVYAVDPHPSASFLIALFVWLFLWEIGGQNIPNDWTDVQEDLRIEAKTLPVKFGDGGSISLILSSLAIAVAVSLSLCWLAPAGLGPFYLGGAVVSGLFLLLLPAYRLYRTRAPEDAHALFTRASYYPLAMLFVVVISWTS
jgi:4-hydroxybenzoate polyprenyltransferase